MKTLKPSLQTLKTGPQSLSKTTRLTGNTLQKIRREKLLANPACERCINQGIVTPAVEVDHIVPLWAGGKESDSNRQSLCTTCHQAKTKREASIRASGGALDI
jgi:5-methylcytosine-specific restriction protein A